MRAQTPEIEHMPSLPRREASSPFVVMAQSFEYDFDSGQVCDVETGAVLREEGETLSSPYFWPLALKAS